MAFSSTQIMSDFTLAMSMFTPDVRAPLESMFFYAFWIMNNIPEAPLFLVYFNTRMDHIRKLNLLYCETNTIAERRVCTAAIILDIVSVAHDVVEHAETFLPALFVRAEDISDWAENAEKMLDQFLDLVRKESPLSPLLGLHIDPRTMPSFSVAAVPQATIIPIVRTNPFPPDRAFTPPAFSTTNVSFQYDKVDDEQCILILLIPSFLPGLLSHVIGGGGSSIVCAEERFKVRIRVGMAAAIRHVNCGPAFKPMIIKGRLMDTVRAQQYMSARLDNKLRSEQLPRGVLHLFVPTIATKFLIGKHGSNVNRVMHESGTRIQFEVEEPIHLGLSGRIVSIYGTLNGCSKAHYLMARQMTDERMIEPQWDHTTYIDPTLATAATVRAT